MPNKLSKHTLDESFISPLNEQRLTQEPGPDVFNIPVISPADPLKLIPQQAKKAHGKGPKITGTE